MGQYCQRAPNEYYAHWSGGINWFKDLEQFSLESKENMEQLAIVLKTLQSLRDCIGTAAEAAYLTPDELISLKFKLSAFDTDSLYSKATRLVPFVMEHDRCLANTRSERWWWVWP